MIFTNQRETINLHIPNTLSPPPPPLFTSLRKKRVTLTKRSKVKCRKLEYVKRVGFPVLLLFVSMGSDTHPAPLRAVGGKEGGGGALCCSFCCFPFGFLLPSSLFASFSSFLIFFCVCFLFLSSRVSLFLPPFLLSHYLSLLSLSFSIPLFTAFFCFPLYRLFSLSSPARPLPCTTA